MFPVESYMGHSVTTDICDRLYGSVNINYPVIIMVFEAWIEESKARIVLLT
jgi:hypothetical protein